MENFIFCAAFTNIFWFIVKIPVTIILQNISKYPSNNSWFRLNFLGSAFNYRNASIKHCTHKANFWINNALE